MEVTRETEDIRVAVLFPLRVSCQYPWENKAVPVARINQRISLPPEGLGFPTANARELNIDTLFQEDADGLNRN